MATEISISFDRESCRTCGLCVEVCVHAKLEQPDEDAPPRVVAERDCIACGHCVAICPSGALSHSEFGPGSIRPIAGELIPDAAQLMEALRARRSFREFKDEPVAREDLERVIEAARLAPSDHNSQSTSFIVVQDAETLRALVNVTVESLAGLSKTLRHPVKGTMARLLGGDQVRGVMELLDTFDAVVELARQGQDIIMWDAPALLVFYSSESGRYAAASANLAIQNATLMAQSLGLGSFYTGFLLAPTMRGFAMHDVLGLAHDQHIHGALGLGVPRVKYRNWPSRRPANVTWI